MVKFGLLGLGYIAPRHVSAIQDNKGKLLLAYSASPTPAKFLPTTTRFVYSEAHFYNLAKELGLNYIAICSPSHLHHHQTIKTLQSGMNAIVEKPLCLSLKELSEIETMEKATGQSAFTIYQLRYHIIRKTIAQLDTGEENNHIILTYKGARNKAYFTDWKGDIKHSGGIFAAVGLHYFDLLITQFGQMKVLQNAINSTKHSSGSIKLDRAKVTWSFDFVSNENTEIPVKRQFIINDTPIDLSVYTKDLHSIAYREILNGNGIKTKEAKEVTSLLTAINNK